MRDFKQIQVWQKAHQFTLKIYKITATFPSDERFGLIAKYAVRRHPYQRISLRVLVEKLKKNLPVLFILHLVQLAKSNINYYFPTNLAIYHQKNIRP